VIWQVPAFYYSLRYLSVNIANSQKYAKVVQNSAADRLDHEGSPGNFSMSTYSFILYIAGNLPNSVQAVLNLKAICTDHFPQDYRLEIVDVLREPQRGLNDGVLVTPTLVKLEPEPKQVIMGNLSNVSTVLHSISWNGTTK
jgi:circadian clock protein KaiB